MFHPFNRWANRKARFGMVNVSSPDFATTVIPPCRGRSFPSIAGQVLAWSGIAVAGVISIVPILLFAWFASVVLALLVGVAVPLLCVACLAVGRR